MAPSSADKNTKSLEELEIIHAVDRDAGRLIQVLAPKLPMKPCRAHILRTQNGGGSMLA